MFSQTTREDWEIGDVLIEEYSCENWKILFFGHHGKEKYMHIESQNKKWKDVLEHNGIGDSWYRYMKNNS